MRGQVLAAQGAVIWIDAGPSFSPPPDPRKAKARRGAVRTFSDRSRRRLKITIHRLKWPKCALFVTLTFAEPVAHWFAKKELRRILMWLERKLPRWGIVWKLEFQQRGVHHFHLLLMPPDDIKSPFLSHRDLWDAWRNGFVWIEIVPVNRLSSYVSKYVQKRAGEEDTQPPEPSLDKTTISSHPAGPGRFWGLRGYVVWAPVVRRVPEWAVRRALEKFERILDYWRAQGIRIGGVIPVCIDRQILPQPA